jgi:hypothetical protein
MCTETVGTGLTAAVLVRGVPIETFKKVFFIIYDRR